MRDSETWSSQTEEISSNFVQINEEISPRSLVATGFAIGATIAVMAAGGRLAVIYSPKLSAWGYLLLVLFIAPFLISYSERMEAIVGEDGLYGFVRRRYGLTYPFFIGWLEVAGYVTIIAVMVRVVAIYGVTVYEYLVGEVNVNLSLLTMGVMLLVILFRVAGLRGSNKLSNTLIFAGLLFLATLSFYSLIQFPDAVTEIPIPLKNVAPFRLSALLVSSFWGVILIFGERQHVVKGTRKPITKAGWTIMLMVIALGVLVSWGLLPGVDNDTIRGVLSTNNRSALIFLGDPIYSVLIGVFAVIFALIGLGRALTASATVISLMTEDGYFPPSFNYRVRKDVFPPLVIVGLLALFLIFFIESLVVIGMAAAFILAVTFLIHFPDLLRSESTLPASRPIYLPFHPLFPALTTVIATLALLNLPRESLQWAGIWALLGAGVLVLYSFNRAIKTRAKSSIIAEGDRMPEATSEEGERPRGPVVMVLVRDLESVSPMVRVASRVARRLQGEVVVMQIVEVGEELTDEEKKAYGATFWRQLAGYIQEMPDVATDVSLKPMVRVAQDVILGVINAAEEVRPQYLFVSPDFIAEDFDQNLLDYDEILRKPSWHIVLLNKLPVSERFQHIAVFVDQGIQAPVTLNLAQMLLDEGGELEIVHLLTGGGVNKPTVQSQTRERLLTILQQQGISEEEVTLTILPVQSMEEGAAFVVSHADLTVLGANKHFMTRLPTFTGINAHLFQNLKAPIMLVAKREKLRFGLFSNFWVFLTRYLPKLTLEEREEAARAIISAADPTVDFFFLILLSAGIATYGLLQNSGAVIIGAMLVAPLMSPIVAIAMSMIRGDVKHLGLAAQSTAQGVLLAIAVGAVLTFFSPIKSPTNEILNRVHPNLLDLSIAFLSGAAGAYAMSRKSIASALPGVSIAVALVPPLAVVGYGFAVADLDIALGALLLFLTNLVAIVLAASLIFIALDFLTTEKQTWGEIIRGLKVTLSFALLVLMILGWVTYTTVDEQRKLNAINNVLTQTLYKAAFKPLEVKIEQHRGGTYVIKGTLLSFERPLSSEELAKLGDELEKAVGGPVTLEITMIPATFEDITLEKAVTSLEIEEAIRAALGKLPLQIIFVEFEPVPDRFEVVVGVMAFEEDVIDNTMISELEQALTAKHGKPVKISVYVIPAKAITPEQLNPSNTAPSATPMVSPSLTMPPAP